MPCAPPRLPVWTAPGIAALERIHAELLARALAEEVSGTGEKILQVLRDKVSPEALAVQPFRKMELLRARPAGAAHPAGGAKAYGRGARPPEMTRTNDQGPEGP